MLANPAPQFSLSAQLPAEAMESQLATQRRVLRKRKPEAPPENNERLSKRLSLLNLEHSGTKLYVPVESQQTQSTAPPHPLDQSLPNGNCNSVNGKPRRQPKAAADADPDSDSMMQLDDSKYKVYIRNLDEELSSESEAEEGGLIFLPDIEKHLRNNRIPPAVLVRPDPDMLSKQLVLYSVPSSISIPKEQDSVRKAIIEARARLREKQQGLKNDSTPLPTEPTTIVEDVMVDDDEFSSVPAIPPPTPQEEDIDAMELD